MDEIQTKKKIYIDPYEMSDDITGLNEQQIQGIRERKHLLELISKHDLPIERLRVPDPRRNDEFGRFCPIDLICWSAKTPTIGEQKIRSYKSDAFEDWAVQTNKLDLINKWVKQYVPKHYLDRLNILLIYTFSDRVTAIWNLRHARPTRRERTKDKWFNVDAAGNRIDRFKDVTYYSLKDALILP